MSAIALMPKLVLSIVEREVYLVNAHKKAPSRRNFAKYENMARAIVLIGSRLREILEIKICTRK